VAGLVPRGLEDELAGKRVAVGVQAGGRQPDENVTLADTFPGNQFVAIDDADDEAGQVVFSVGVEAGHLRGFAADERASIFLAGLRQPSDYLLDDFVFKTPGGEVVEKEERLSALDSNVVDAVIDQVLPHGVMDAELKGDLEFGADAVRAGNEHRTLISLQVRCEERTEAANAAEHAPGEGLLRECLDALLGLIAAGDVDAGIGVSDLLALCCGQRDSFQRKRSSCEGLVYQRRTLCRPLATGCSTPCWTASWVASNRWKRRSSSHC